GEGPETGDPSWGDDLRGTYTYLMSVPKPIIAAINGPIAGMAVPIALACDLRFMARDAVLTVAFSQRGLIAEWGVSWMLPRLTGSAAALDLLFSSRKVDGAECERIGLVNRAIDGSVVDEARSYIVDLAAKCSPSSLAVMKRQVYQQLHSGLGPAEREAQSLMLESFDRPDFGEGVRSFLDKRAPKFQRLPIE
ncbi:MAG TPA: enoyl-CoA hydratase-related protein, partial [Acidimicrobiales bacterium]|nr:enoyl-CoA hydratase-related protein [Acidimicrobiales bacterium]